MTLLALGGAWAAYCALHSALISRSVTLAAQRRLGKGFRFYRLFFNVVAFVTLVPLAHWSLSVEGAPVFRWAGAPRAAQYALVACGLTLFVAGARHYSLGLFLGIRQLTRGHAGGLASDGGIDASGILGAVRHPWYVAVALLLWARDMDAARLVVNAVLTTYLFVGTLLEERKLVLEFGDAYTSYQRRVSMFLPLKWLRSHVAA